ncbi:cilia- and flagella-associated protein 45-like isoform X2 [Corvus hawaiiensis]|uniref:cilia- and flagella-associated protein 45-like isoform X2 n=1 Tax=Corvus hawaiiensis TaxID=134902 RepID=UPI0020197C91|nr:cilia- and flagella-associated protein 45-like isoform X2 [Corvus hawaiiensis]
MAAATAGTGSRSLRAGGSSRRSLLARRLQLSPPGFQSVRPDVSPLGARAPQLPHTPQNVHLLPLTPGRSVPSGRAPPTAPRPIPAEFPELPPGSVGVRGRPDGGSGSSDFSFLQVTGSSNPIVISQDVPKHPRDLPSLKPKLKTIRIITKDLIRDLIIPQEKPQPCLIIGKKEYEKIKESARSPTEEERWDRLKTLKARQDAAFLFLNSKCNMIRDKQILEKRMIRKELAEEEKRLDKMMEMEWEKGVAVQEELERQRKQEMMRARQDLVKQMEQNAEKRALRDEEKYQEGQKLLECLEHMKKEDRKAWEQKQERHRQIHAEIQYFNTESQRLKDEQRERERLEDERVLEQQRQKAEREAALEAEQEQLRLEKEKELARLRAAQERARDWQAERDALMAKRNQEAADREWRRQELENARKKVELEQQLRRDRLEQVAQKEQYLAMQVEQDRQEFQRVLRAHQEQLEREKLQREQRELQQRAHAEDLRRQIQELRQQRERERAAFIEEGRQQEQEVRQRNRRLAQLGQQKLQEFRATGMPDKYCAQVERKAQRRANAALS